MSGLFWRRGQQGGVDDPYASNVALNDEETQSVEREDPREIAERLAVGENREAIEAVYNDLVVRLNEREPDVRYRAMTPRKLRERFSSTPIAGAVTEVTEIHEAIVYAGCVPTDEDRRRVIEGFIAALSEPESVER